MSKKLFFIVPFLAAALCGCGADLTSAYLAFKAQKKEAAPAPAAAKRPAAKPAEKYEGVAIVNKGTSEEVTQILKTAQNLAKNRVQHARTNYGEEAAKEADGIYRAMFNHIFTLSKTEEPAALKKKAGEFMRAANTKYSALEAKYPLKQSAVVTENPQSSYGKAVKRAVDAGNALSQRDTEYGTSNL